MSLRQMLKCQWCLVYIEVRRKFSTSVFVFFILGFLCDVLAVISKNYLF